MTRVRECRATRTALVACLGLWACGGDPSPLATDGGEPIEPDVPINEYCAPVATWDEAWRAREDEIVRLVNDQRAVGGSCGSAGTLGPVAALAPHPALRCAARVHSKDMADRGFIGHQNPDGELPWDRQERAGYEWAVSGENIGWGSDSAAVTMQRWMNSPLHCANILDRDFTEIGVGYYPEGNFWTQSFGTPR